MASFRVKADSKSLYENGVLSGNVLSNDTRAITVTHVKLGSEGFVPVTSGGTVLIGTYGILTIRPDGSYTYESSTAQAESLALGMTAKDVFTYTAVNATGTSGSATLTLNIVGRNDAPVLTSTTATLSPITEDDTGNGGQAVSTFLSSTDVDSGALSGIAIRDLSSGNGVWQYSLDGGANWRDVGTVSTTSALLLRSTDFVRFVPNGTQGTSASFTYRAWDQSTGTAGTKASTTSFGNDKAFSSAIGTASIAVGAVNDPPVAVNDSATTNRDEPIIIDVLGNDTDPDGGTLSLTSVTAASNGTAVIQSGTIVYTPDSGYVGPDTFTYTVSDGQGGTVVGSVSVTVATPTNAAPVATDDAVATASDTAVRIDVLANDGDPDGDALTIASLGTASSGTVEIDDGQIRYTPNDGFTGTDSFTYTISDGRGGTDIGSVSVSVGAPPPPSAVTITFRQGTDGYSGTVDTMLKEKSPTIAFGNAIVIAPDADSGAQVQGLLAFNHLFGTGAGQIPPGAIIISATLTLQTTNSTVNAGTLYRMLTDWNGSSTWSNEGNGIQIGAEASSDGALALGAAAVGSRAFDVTASLQSWLAAGTSSSAQNAANLGWLFQPGSTDDWNFGSAESAFKPSLVVSYIPSGSPSTPPNLPTASISGPVTGGPQMEGGRIAFTVSLSQASAQNVTLTFATADGTAKAGADYLAAAGSITFLPGETSKQVEVQLVNDATAERPESFSMQITSATNAKVATAFATVTITDDDVITALMPSITATVVAVHNLANGATYQDGSAGRYGIADPSAIAYIPGLDTLYIGDSEHDESPFNSTVNMFAVKTDGSFVRNHSLTSYTKEPTGLAYNSTNGLLYVADDDKHGVFWVDPLNPSAKLGYFDTRPLGLADTEDLKIDPLTGHIHVLDGILKQIIELTINGVFVDSIPLPPIMRDAEALAYHPTFDLFFVGSGASNLIWVIDRAGTIKATLDVLNAYSPEIKGFELAPSSDPDDGDTLSLYVVDYGRDQVNDGRLFEVSLGPDWFL